MDSPLYIAAAAAFVTLVAALFGAVLFALHTGLRKLNYAPSRRKQITGLAAAGMLSWLAVLGALAQVGFFQNFSTLPPRIFLALSVPMLTIIWMANSGKVKELLQVLPGQWLVGFQGFRVLMELILWAVFAAGVIPVQMTFEGRNWDVLAGLFGPLVGYLVFVRKTWPERMAVLYNFVSLALLLNIVVISSMSTPSPLRVFLNEPANTFIAYLPFVWLPGFVVPMALAGHVLSLRQLWAKSRKNASGAVLKQFV